MASDFHHDLRTVTRQALTAFTAGGGDAQTLEQWNRTVGQLGLAGLLIDAEQGGLGLGTPEMVLVGAEIGRTLPASPFLSTSVLAATLLLRSDTGAAERLLAEIAEGSRTYVVAVADEGDDWLQAQPTTSAAKLDSPDGDRWQLAGRTGCAIGSPGNGHSTAVLVQAVTTGGNALFAVEPDLVALSAADMLDPTRGLIDIEFDKTPAQMIATPAATAPAVVAAYGQGLLAVAAEQVGVARACLDAAVEHAKTRYQFGSPIGSFQAIKHRCVDVLLKTEMAAAALEDATLDENNSAATELAFLLSCDAAIFAAESSIHIHGGTGFTWEHPAHRYLRRARVNAQIFGAVAHHREVIAASAGLEGAALR